MTLADLVRAGDWWDDAYWPAVDAADDGDAAAVLVLVDDPDAAVRGLAVTTLAHLSHGGPPTEDVVEAALRRSRDEDTRVRDLATFILGQQLREVDTPALREALVERLDDDDHETRCEALLGLAYRRDPRALPRLREVLSRPDDTVWQLELQAAAALADARLHPLVLRHQTGWDDSDAARTAEMARRLTDPDGPGDDVLDGAAALYRVRAHGGDDAEEHLAAIRLLQDMTDLASHRADEFLAAVLARLEGDDAAQDEVRHRSAIAQDALDG
ncbi:HEAT repeat domain-containing protein [Cellulomonas cellasea]|uniref:HEAT repeat protein n=1 Tax=Cellulomonas cellasea TaxID=43670 RepID=A0A7W4UIL7_9CELL|nr:HEAT repeat domain-containing protein [Cellulomonas cellasea]MBB2924857.1 HEAT repeat protein [Cellulomonas cellasea]